MSTDTGKDTGTDMSIDMSTAANSSMSAAMKGLRGSTAIAGVATFGCGEAPGFTDMELLARSARAAVADAGLKMSDIDGLCTASSSAAMWAMPVAEYLGLRPRFIDSTMLGGSSFIAHLLPAMHALRSGQCSAVLVCYGSAQRTAAFGRREMVASRRFLDPQPYETPYEPMLPPSAYALAASRHMHEFGTTRRDLAEVAVAARAWARLNPEAFMRDPLSIADVLASRMVSDPLSVRDCCLVTDGGGAYVLVSAERARDLAQKPVYVLGNATAVWNRQISSMHDLTVTAASESGREAFTMAGLQPKDIDVVQLYDAFTINTLLFLEDLGFCKKGEGGAFVRDGAIAPGGRLPVNTNGGGLSCVHPGMYGIFALIEAVRQLRGGCGERQVSGASTALAHGNGGMLSSQSTAILGTSDAL
jgi:acetyl-CoA acetyltransferase